MPEISSVGSLAQRIERLGALMSLISPIPDEWASERKETPRNRRTGAELECLPCRNYRDLTLAWKKALRWTEGLDVTLSVMLASITSTKSVGDQLWVKVIGPASCGKSTLCEAISVAQKYVLAKSTIRGFHSGWKGAGGEEEDNSLVALAMGKTLVTKDGDTLLQSPNLGQILSEARDLYDSTSRTHYRNAMSKDYSGIRMTWLLCGTSSLRQIDSSELGERFLDCVVMDEIEDDLEDEILWRVVNRVDRNMAIEADGMAETQYEPEMANAMMLTGGYVEYLRVNATNLLSQVHAPDEAKRMCAYLGKFVAFMRARPSKKQDETTEREFAARLVSQHMRLAKCLAVVLNRRVVDGEVMRRVRKVAMDTSRGSTLRIVELLAKYPVGLDLKAIEVYTDKPGDNLRKMLTFLRAIGAVEKNLVKVEGARTHQTKWRLTHRLRTLWQNVHQ